MKTCFMAAIGGFPIMLEQAGVDRFVVTYGQQVKRDLPYGKAATELGAAIMHALACEGKLNNAERKRK